MNSGKHEWLRDALALRLPDYFVYIGRDRLYFLKLVGKSVVTVARSRVMDIDGTTLDRFLSEIRVNGYYYGQPLSVLLNDSVSFSYIRRIRRESPADLLKRIQSVDTDAYHITSSVIHLKHGRVFVTQGIGKPVHEAVYESLKKHDISCLSMANLGLYLFVHGVDVSHGSRADRFRWIDGSAVLTASDDLGNVIAEQVETTDKSATMEITEQARQLLPTLPEQFKVLDHPLTKQERSASKTLKPVADILRSALAKPSLTHRTDLGSGDPLQSRIEKTISNSLGLLAKTLASAALLLILLLSVFRLNSSSVEADDNGFKREYSEVLSLQLRRDTLVEKYERLTAAANAKTNLSALLSMFCQENYTGLQLDEVTIRADNDGQIMVSAHGLSRSESRVFRLESNLNKLSGGVEVRVAKLEPVLSHQRQTVDTLYSFRLNLERSE